MGTMLTFYENEKRKENFVNHINVNKKLPQLSRQCVGLLDARPGFKHLGQKSKRKKRYFTSATSSQQISGEKLRRNKTAMKNFSKIYRWGQL